MTRLLDRLNSNKTTHLYLFLLLFFLVSAQHSPLLFPPPAQSPLSLVVVVSSIPKPIPTTCAAFASPSTLFFFFITIHVLSFVFQLIASVCVGCCESPSFFFFLVLFFLLYIIHITLNISVVLVIIFPTLNLLSIFFFHAKGVFSYTHLYH